MKTLRISLLALVLTLATLAARASTIVTVGTTTDASSSSPLSLRMAIANANNATASQLPYIIQVPPGTYKLTLGQLNIGTGEGSGPANNILIVGTGTAASTVITQSDGINRIFNLDPNIDGGQTFALANLTITGGHDTEDGNGGAGVLTGQATLGVAQDFLFMTNCIISNNVTTGIDGQPGPGAGLGSDGGSTTLVGCTFVKNTVTSANNGNLQGAGVTFQAWNSKDTLTAINCQFLQNAINASGPDQYAEGAGLYLQHESTIYPTCRLTNCLFAGNVATMANYTSTGLADYGGGGLYLDTGSTAGIVGCTFSNNAAIGATGGASGKGGNGGAILAAESQTSATIEFCRFVGNAGAAGGASNIWSSSAASASIINANDNWWGSDAGPPSGANVNITTPADWLFLTNTATANSVSVGGTDALTVSFLKDSAGNAIPASSLSALTNLPVFFGATDGSVSGAQTVIQTSGTATDTFTGTTPGSGSDSATVDGVTSTASISVVGGVGNVSSSPVSHYYKAGQTVPVTITFGEAVTVTGSPKLSLSDGGTAVYASGSGTATLTFNYVVGTSDTSSHLDYASTTALTLNGGTINSGGVAANLTLPGPGSAGSLGANTTLVIDTVPPTVVISAPSVTSTTTGPVSYTVTFSDANLASAALSAASAQVNQNGTSYSMLTVTPGTGNSTSTNFTVTLSGVSGSGTLGITIPAGAATDLAGNASAASTSATVNVLPSVSGVTASPASHYYRAGQVVPITVSFSGAVSVAGTPQLALSDGGSAAYSSGSGTASLTFNYLVGASDTSPHLDYASPTALSLNGGSIAANGSSVSLTLPVPGTAGSLGANTTLVIDTTPPAVVISTPSVTSTNTGSVKYTVTFSDTNLYNATLTAGNVITVSSGTATLTNVNVTPGTGTPQSTNFTVTLSGVAGNGTLAITIPTEVAVDLAGNNSASTTSASVTVFIPSSPVVTGLKSGGKGIVQFGFTNNPNASFSVLSSTNLLLPLTNWGVVGAPTNNPPGVFQYTSLPTTNDPVRFYRIRSP